MEGSSRYNVVKKEPKSMLSGVLFLILTVMYTIAYNEDLRATSILWYGISIIAIAYLAYVVSTKCMHKSLGVYAIWAGAFFAYSFISGLWAADVSKVLDTSKTLFLIFIVNILLSFVVETKEDVRNILLANFLALVLYLIYVLLNVDLSQLGEDRLGVDFLGSLWNANDVGIKLCFGFALALYFAFEQKHIAWKLILFAIGLLFAGVGLFTGSRKVFLMLMGIAVLFMFLYSKHKFIGMAIAIASAIAFYFAIMEIESLYNVLGQRIENMLEGLFGQGTTEGSFNTREEMIRLGFGWFLERPLFGYGMSNFSVLYEIEKGWSTYSHNNFIEILINGGIVGFILYYFIYAYIFVKLFKAAFVKRDSTAIILFTINLVLIALQIAAVSYYDTLFNCILLLAVMYVKVGGKSA